MEANGETEVCDKGSHDEGHGLTTDIQSAQALSFNIRKTIIEAAAEAAAAADTNQNSDEDLSPSTDFPALL